MFFRCYIFHWMTNIFFIIYHIFKFTTFKIKIVTFINTFSQLFISISVYDFGFDSTNSEIGVQPYSSFIFSGTFLFQQYDIYYF